MYRVSWCYFKYIDKGSTSIGSASADNCVDGCHPPEGATHAESDALCKIVFVGSLLGLVKAFEAVPNDVLVAAAEAQRLLHGAFTRVPCRTQADSYDRR